MTFNVHRSARMTLLATAACVTVAGCSEPLDFDMRGLGGGFSTANAVQAPLEDRPQPDDRGVISYPNYQVAVARRGDTLRDVAQRINLDPEQLARFNGIDADVQLRKDEIIALPSRVAEPSPETGAVSTGPIQPVDITSVAGGAIDRVPATPGVETAALEPAPNAAPAPTQQPQTGNEPIRHKVERGETAFTIARLYNVPVASLAEWNGLGADFQIRADQFLLIPVAQQQPPRRTPEPTIDETPRPGEGSQTPTPPSAAKPLPEETVAPAVAAEEPAAEAEEPQEPVADIGQTTEPATTGKLLRPVNGTIIRDYAKGKNEGINIKADPGTPVKVADAGTVAAITQSADGIPIVVVRHTGNLLTVYANVTEVSVTKGDSVSRGQNIAKLRAGDDSFVHFEVREGFESVDPNPFLN